jgi:hypothetical protein
MLRTQEVLKILEFVTHFFNFLLNVMSSTQWTMSAILAMFNKFLRKVRHFKCEMLMCS